MMKRVALAVLAVAPLIALVALEFRLIQIVVLARATDSRVALSLVPLLDVLQFGAQFVPYFDDTVTWRGYTARIGPKTVLLDILKTAAA